MLSSFSSSLSIDHSLSSLALSFPCSLRHSLYWYAVTLQACTPSDTHTHTHTLTDETPGSGAKQKSTSHPLPLVSAVTCPSVRSPIGQPSCDPCSKGFWDLEFPRVKSSAGIYCTGSHVYSSVCVWLIVSELITHLWGNREGSPLRSDRYCQSPPVFTTLLGKDYSSFRMACRRMCVWERVTSSIPSLFNSTKLNDLTRQCEYRWDWRVRFRGLRAC